MLQPTEGKITEALVFSPAMRKAIGEQIIIEKQPKKAFEKPWRLKRKRGRSVSFQLPFLCSGAVLGPNKVGENIRATDPHTVSEPETQNSFIWYHLQPT